MFKVLETKTITITKNNDNNKIKNGSIGGKRKREHENKLLNLIQLSPVIVVGVKLSKGVQFCKCSQIGQLNFVKCEV